MLHQEAPSAAKQTNRERERKRTMTAHKPEKRHTDVLLDFSEKAFLRDLEPYEYHTYCGWEEAVCGWARAAPLSCIFLNLKENCQPRRDFAERSSHGVADAYQHNDEHSAFSAEHHHEWQAGGRGHAPKKSTPLSQRVDALCDTVMAAAQLDDPDGPDFEDSLRKMEEEGSPQEAPHLRSGTKSKKFIKYRKSRNRSKVTAKKTYKLNNNLVPITNFTVTVPELPTVKKTAPKKTNERK